MIMYTLSPTHPLFLLVLINEVMSREAKCQKSVNRDLVKRFLVKPGQAVLLLIILFLLRT